MLSLGEAHRYWVAPDDGQNRYEVSASKWERSDFLVSLMDRYAGRYWRILEIGCGVGRNLQALQTAGYLHLEAIEISVNALAELRRRFMVGQTARLRHGSVETLIQDLPRDAYDAVFTMAMLEHLHPDSEWVLPEIARITRRLLLTIEDERTVSPRHFPRNYGRIFKALGMKQVKRVRKCPGLPRTFVARTFSKEAP